MRLWKMLRWVLVNGLFAGLFWFGFKQGIEWMKVTALIVAWLSLPISMLFMVVSAVEPLSVLNKAVTVRGVPLAFDHIFDLVITGVLMYWGYTVTAGVYALHICALRMAFTMQDWRRATESETE